MKKQHNHVDAIEKTHERAKQRRNKKKEKQRMVNVHEMTRISDHLPAELIPQVIAVLLNNG